MATPLGISTSWNAARVVDGRGIVEELVALGFRNLEVDYRVTAEAARVIRDFVKAGEITVSSVHNFSPMLPGEKPTNSGGHKLSLATTDEDERRRAVDLSLVSAELARDLGARVLVLHLGETDIPRERSVALGRVVKAEGVSSPEAVGMRRELESERAAKVAPLLDAAARSLDEILRGAGPDLVLGVENRNYYHQIPLPPEVLELINRVGSSRVRYWHDVGHAHVLEILGFAPHLETLKSMVPYLVGMHLHDSVFTADHKAPGTGEIDFAPILALAPAEALKVLELTPTVTRDEIRAGVTCLESLGVSP